MKTLLWSMLVVGLTGLSLAVRDGMAPAASPAAMPEAAVLPATAPLPAESAEETPRLSTPRRGPDPERIKVAVERGLEYLRRMQDPATGSWIQHIGYKFNSEYNITSRDQAHVGVTSLALMAFLSGGHLPERGLHREVVQRGTDFILGAVDDESGYITHAGSRMYDHAFAALFLAEIYGMTHREDVREKLQQAVDLTRKAQNEIGSWRYDPHSPESDMSITVCQIMALRAARNVGIRVPKATIDRAYEYVIQSAHGPNSGQYGGFKYQLKDLTRTSFAMTAAGVATLNHTGTYEHELVSAGMNFLRREIPRMSRGMYKFHYFYWYGHYYAAQVFFMAGDQRPELWEWYWELIANELLDGQLPDGSWPNPVGPGTSFSTAVATIILQIPNQYLPIFHR